MENFDQDKFLRLPSVLALVAVGRSTLFHMIKAGEFPAAYRVGKRAVAWKASEVQQWITGRRNT